MEILASAAIVMLALALSSGAGAPLIGFFLKRALRRTDVASASETASGCETEAGSPDAPNASGSPDAPNAPNASGAPDAPLAAPPELLRGGTWIGILERAAVTAAVLAGQYAVIAVVVAVKGFGRFDQLRGNPAASEKFVVGTLASLLWAAGVGGAASWILGQL